MKAHSIQKNHSNETGRSMVEILGVLSIMGVLSLAAIAGIAYTIRKQVVVETVGLIDKSTAGILTSGILEKGSNVNIENEMQEDLFSTQAIQLNSYMSNVPLTTADDREKYGSETFVGPRGSVFSVYPAVTQEYGFMLTIHKMQSVVCEDVLSYDLKYNAVVRVETNGQPIGSFVSAVDLEDAQKRKEFCHSDDGEVNIGFVFERDNIPAHPSCNRACAIELVGGCVLTSSESCNNERQYYSSSQCKCVCYDSRATGENCDCPANLVWDSNSQECVQCLSNSDCSGNTPVCNGDTNTCESCPTSTPVWNGTSCEACSESTPVWNGTACVECLGDMDCSENAPVCNADTNTCESCSENTPKWNGTSCVECLVNEDCEEPTKAVCKTETNTCEYVTCTSNTDCNNGSETGGNYCRIKPGYNQSSGWCERLQFKRGVLDSIGNKKLYWSKNSIGWRAANNFCAALGLRLFGTNLLDYCTEAEVNKALTTGSATCSALNLTNEWQYPGWTGSAGTWQLWGKQMGPESGCTGISVQFWNGGLVNYFKSNGSDSEHALCEE